VSLQFTVSAFDPEGQALSYRASGLPAGAGFNSNIRKFSWTPSFTSTGAYTVTFFASDGLHEVSKSVSITVNNVNRAPTAQNTQITVEEDVQKSIALNCSDADSDSLAYSIVSNPSAGNLSGSGNSRTYTPRANYAGPDSFTYRCSDGSVNSNTATVSVTITNVNDAPTVNSIPPLGTCDVGQSITLRCEASDSDGSLQSVKLWAGQCDTGNCFDTRSWSIGRGKTYYGTNAEFTGAAMERLSGNTYTKTFTIDQPIGTSIAATCRAQDNAGLLSNWADGYPVCEIGGCQSNPVFSNIDIYPNPTGVGDVEIRFTADRDLPANPIVKIRWTTVEYDAVFSSKSGNEYTYLFTVSPDHLAVTYSVDIEGTDSNGCGGRANGMMSVSLSPRIKINGVEGNSFDIQLEEGGEDSVNLEWDVNLPEATIMILVADTGEEVDRFDGTAGTKDLGNLEPGRYIIRILNEAPPSGTGVPTGSAILDITGYQSVGDAPLAQFYDFELDIFPGTIPPEDLIIAPLPSGETPPLSQNSILIKMDHQQEQLWDFKWKTAHHTEGGNGGRSDRPDLCGIWMIEEDDQCCNDNSGWTLVEQGAIIKKDASSIRTSFGCDSYSCDNIESCPAVSRCEKDGEDVCDIICKPFDSRSHDRCGSDNCNLAKEKMNYRPIGDLICAQDAKQNHNKARWYLCNSNGYEIKVGGNKYRCLVESGQAYGQWLPIEDCTTQADDDGDGRANCADSECYGTDRTIINAPDGDIGEHDLPSGMAYYHPACDPDTNMYVCVDALNLDPSMSQSDVKDISFSRNPYRFITGAGCCGDDSQDAGRVVNGNKLCYMSTSNPGEWKLASPSTVLTEDNTGKVFVTNNIPYISDGNQWLYCDGTSFKKYSDRSLVESPITIEGKDYVCGESIDGT
ncbi:cadherin-like domain-containing protein, partial [Candidatus Woesearchaeota archaeon]|nr:cadherin-like domain-containing protein [Candidatus Woesearchaeota archaeon]